MTNTRMENGGNLSQSMDSVNNVAVVGEEEVRTTHFYFPPRVDLIKVGCMVQSTVLISFLSVKVVDKLTA